MRTGQVTKPTNNAVEDNLIGSKPLMGLRESSVAEVSSSQLELATEPEVCDAVLEQIAHGSSLSGKLAPPPVKSP
eukprot:scaffold52264_cov31-Prasinocladus_malaysianus.AAC.1